MKLKYQFVTNQVADRIVAVAVGDDLAKFNGFIKMNDIGAFIFNLLKSDITEDELAIKMKNEYSDASEEEIREAIGEFIGILVKEDVIEM